MFAVMERLTAELFNTYVQRSGDAEPYYTEYCDGRTVTCPGMKQWGTVERAKEGKNALQILRYYYGKRVQLVTTDNIASIPSSYPGSPLRRGSSGTNVRILQKQLSRIAKDYPSFGKPVVNGVFDEATERSVKRFQKQFGLKEPVDCEKLLHEVKVSGLDIVELKGYTSSGIALSVCRLVGAIMRNERAVVPASVVLEGEYGLEGIAMSLPCVISRNGVERTLQIPLDKEGEKNLKICYEYLRNVIESIS